jgi:hypothetical protein
VKLGAPPDQRAQLAQEAREVLRCRLGRGHQHIEVVQRGAQVDERRVGLAQRAGQQRQRLVERLVLVADRGRGRIRVGDEVREVDAARGEGTRRPGRVAQEGVERLLVGDDLVDDGATRSGPGWKYLVAAFACTPLRAIPRRVPG